MNLYYNDFIKYIEKESAWGVSDDQKRPLYVGRYLETKNPSDIDVAYMEYLDKLPNLIQINANPSFNETNRAYRLHAADNLVVSFDIEPKSDPSYLAHFASLPAHYAEYSRNNGVHLYYKLSHTRLSEKAIDMVTTKTVYKYSNLKEVAENPTIKPLEYELLMNNHWVTFTNKPIINENITIQVDVPDSIYDQINRIAESLSTISTEYIDLEIEETELSEKLKELIKENKKYLNELKELTKLDFNDDESLYEYNIIFRLAGVLERRLNRPQVYDAMYLETAIEDIDISDKIAAVASLAKDILEFRDKHNTVRENQPWLVYNARKAYEWILANTTTE